MTVNILVGDCREKLKELPDNYFHTCVSSPPYFGLRSYGIGSENGEIGLEPTPDAFVAALVAVFREVRRVLRDDATVWLNLGDSYAASGMGGNPAESEHRKQATNTGSLIKGRRAPDGLKPKDLIGIPWMVAFALRADGWYLRKDIIWHKPNPMPESVRDRPTSSHEYLFLLAKSSNYYYDADVIKEPVAVANWNDGSRVYGGSNKHGANVNHGERTTGRSTGRPQRVRALEIAREKGLTDEHLAAIRAAGVSDVGKAQVTQTGFGKNTEVVMRLAAEAKAALGGYYREFLTDDTGRNRRSVWTITTHPYSEAHFATFPPALVEPCIKAGSPVGGHVLDPFAGAGTTGLVADRLQRNATLIELNPSYAEMARNRLTKDGGLFAEVAAE